MQRSQHPLPGSTILSNARRPGCSFTERSGRSASAPKNVPPIDAAAGRDYSRDASRFGRYRLFRKNL
jgi:hypothetical protein